MRIAACAERVCGTEESGWPQTLCCLPKYALRIVGVCRRARARTHTHTHTHNAHTRTLLYLLFLTFIPSIDNKAQNNINIYFKQIGVILARASGNPIHLAAMWGDVDYQKC